MAAAVVALTLLAGACGSSTRAGATLPPMITTTTTTSTVFVATTPPVVSFYVVQSGDTLSKIANKFGVTKADLMALNGITNPDHIEKGQRLKIPPATVATTTLPASASSKPSTTA